MVSADGGLVFQQRQEGSRGLIPGYKLTQVQRVLGEGKKDQVQNPG